MQNPATLTGTDRELTRAERRMLGRVEFDRMRADPNSPFRGVHPVAREDFANAFAEITREALSRIKGDAA